jgi:hypothetical protein
VDTLGETIERVRVTVEHLVELGHMNGPLPDIWPPESALDFTCTISAFIVQVPRRFMAITSSNAVSGQLPPIVGLPGK